MLCAKSKSILFALDRLILGRKFLSAKEEFEEGVFEIMDLDYQGTDNSFPVWYSNVDFGAVVRRYILPSFT